MKGIRSFISGWGCLIIAAIFISEFSFMEDFLFWSGWICICSMSLAAGFFNAAIIDYKREKKERGK